MGTKDFVVCRHALLCGVDPFSLPLSQARLKATNAFYDCIFISYNETLPFGSK